MRIQGEYLLISKRSAFLEAKIAVIEQQLAGLRKKCPQISPLYFNHKGKNWSYTQ